MSSIAAQHTSHSKFSCGTVVTAETERMILEKVRHEESRSGSCDDLPLNTAPKKYKLVLEYIKKSNGTLVPDSTQMVNIKALINSKYNPHGITFEYYEYQQDCDNCSLPDDPGWKRDNPFINKVDFKDCLWGRLYFNISSGGSSTNIEKGRFYANTYFLPNITHELGHALGLLHTFDSFKANTSNNENIKQDTTCSCNCRSTGDFICDTPVDPYIDGNNLWNSRMFIQNGNHVIQNLDSVLDNCGNNYLLLNSLPSIPKFYFNMMAYHTQGDTQSGFTAGQASWMKKFSSGKPWEIIGTSTGGGVMEGGFTVNTPTIINSSKDITGNITVNSTLTINNSTLTLLTDNKITIKAGGHLILNNAHIKAFSGMECIPASSSWLGIKIEGPGFCRVTLKNKSSIDNAKIGIESSKKATMLIKVLSGSNINSYWEKSIKIENCLGSLDVYDSSINGPLDVNNFNNIHFSNANLNSLPNGIESNFVNTNLNITNNSFISGPISVNNILNNNINIRNSYFSYSFFVFNCFGTTLLRDNIFNNFIALNNCLKFDVFNNQIHSGEGLKIDGTYPATNPLIFKNQFYSISPTSNSYVHNNGNATSLLQCNTFNSKGVNDLNLKAPIDPNQGNDKLSAGNKFSRTATEIFYSGDQEISYFYKKTGTEEPINIGGSSATKFKKFEALSTATSACALLYPNTPPIPAHCNNGIRDGNEQGTDCGGSCPPCANAPDFPSVDHCTNGIKDSDETAIDCGGSCPPCHCKDGILNGGEVGIDCGGTCPPCFVISQCQNGVMDGNETGIDCGGSCGPCTDGLLSCYNGIMDGNETGIDCGGSCQPCIISYAPSCYNGIMDGNESGIDCGGSCTPCGSDNNPPIYNQTPTAAYQMANHAPFVSQLNGIFGSDIPLGTDISVLPDFNSHSLTLDNGNSCALQSFIINNSVANPALVLQRLQAYSPNVSANAIHILFEKSQYYTSAQIANILSLNPAVLQDRYISYILYKTNTFTSSQKAAILAAESAGSLRQTKEQKLKVKLQYKNAILRDNIVTQSMNYPLNYNLLRSLLAQNPEITKVFEIAQSYADQKKYDIAIQALNQVDMCQLTDPFYRAQRTGLVSIYTVLRDGGSTNHNVENEVNTLTALAASEHGIATDIASGMLTLLSNRSSEIPFKRWQYQPLKFLENDKAIGSQGKIEIFPNPATNVINISIPQFTEASNTIILIKNMEGKILSQHKLNFSASQINIAELPTGMYYIQVETNGKSLGSKNFIKVK